MGAAQDSTSSLLTRALQLTAKRDFNGAEQAYQRLAELDPVNGLPAYARYLYLTGQTTRTQPMLNSPAILTASPSIRASIAIQGGMPEKAVSILKEPAPAGDVYRQAVLLSNQLQMLKRKAEASAVLAGVISMPELTAFERIDLLKKLTNLGDCAALSSAIPEAAAQLVTSSSLDFQLVRPVIWEAMMSRSACDDFAAFHETLQKDPSAVSAWLSALASIHRGDARGAYTTLQTTRKRVLTRREQAFIGEELATIQTGDLHEALKLREELIAAAERPERFHIDAADLATRLGDFSKAMQHVDSIDVSQLQEEEHARLGYVRLAAAAKLYPAGVVVDLFTSVSTGMKWQQLRDLAEGPFEKLGTQEVNAIRQSLLERLRDPNAPPVLYVLLLSAEHHLNSQEGMLAALAGYMAKRPNDTAAQQDFSTVATSMAATLGETAANANDAKATADKAAEALWKVVQARPYEPESYGKLMQLYQFFGDDAKAKRVPLYLTSSTTAPAEAIALAAYIYATNGEPTEAIPLYERALKLEAKNAKFRLNFAGALTRVGRHGEAEDIYHDLLRHGVDGRQYHTHELYAGAWELAMQRDKVSQFVAFLDELRNDPAVPQRDVFLMDAGKLLLRRDHAKDSLKFFQKLQREFPEHASVAQEQMVEALVAMRDFPAAEKQVVAMEKESTSTAEQLRARFMMATVKSAQGDLAAAVDTWQKIATEHPRDETAGRSYLAAAQTLLNAGHPEDASAILQHCLETSNGNVDTESAARQLLEQIQKKQAAQPTTQ